MWEENQKMISLMKKTFQLELKTEKEKPKVCGERRNLVRIRCCFSSQRDRTTNGSIHQNAGSPTLPAPERQISGLPPASSSIENQINSDSSLLPHLARFVARLFGRHRFYLGEKLTVGLAISGALSRGGNIAIDFSGWSL